MKPKSSDLLTMPEAGEVLHCTASQVRKLVRDGVLAGEKCCFKTLRLRRSTLEMLAENGNVSLLRIRAQTAAQLHALATARGESADDLADRLLSNAIANETRSADSAGNVVAEATIESPLASIVRTSKAAEEVGEDVRKRRKGKKKKGK